jgi:hypothetical protein
MTDHCRAATGDVIVSTHVLPRVHVSRPAFGSQTRGVVD